jgi:hypothetical protein
VGVIDKIYLSTVAALCNPDGLIFVLARFLRRYKTGNSEMLLRMCESRFLERRNILGVAGHVVPWPRGPYRQIDECRFSQIWLFLPTGLSRALGPSDPVLPSMPAKI